MFRCSCMYGPSWKRGASSVVFDAMEGGHQGLYQSLLREATGRDPAHPILAFFVEKGVHDTGSAMRFHSLKRKHPSDYARLTLEMRGQGRLS